MNSFNRDYDPRLRYARNREECRQPEKNRLVTSMLCWMPIGLLMWVGIIWAGKAAYAWWSVTR